MDNAQRIARLLNMEIDPNNQLLVNVRNDLLAILYGNLNINQAQDALDNARNYLVPPNNDGREYSRMARFVRNYCRRIIDEHLNQVEDNDGMPLGNIVFERSVNPPPHEFQGKKRVNPKNKISCIKANMNWVKSYKSKDKKVKSVTVKGACRKKNYK